MTVERSSLEDIEKGFGARDVSGKGKFTLVDICKGLMKDKFRNIVVMCGAGINYTDDEHLLQRQYEGFPGLIEADFLVNQTSPVLTYDSFFRRPRNLLFNFAARRLFQASCQIQADVCS